MVNKVLSRVKLDKVDKMLLMTWNLILLIMSTEKPIVLPQKQYMLMNLQKPLHPLLINKTLRLAVWTVSGKSYLKEAFWRQLPKLF